jgi:hypothetical protein
MATLPQIRVGKKWYTPETTPAQVYHASINLTPGLTVRQVQEQCLSKEFFMGVDPMVLDSSADPNLVDSSRFMIALWKLGLTLLSLISAEPSLVEYGRRIKRIKAKTSRAPSEYWSPNIIGRLYRSPVRSLESTQGSSKRPHWVRGYLKNQPYGAKHALRKLIWVQPYRTGIDES